MLSGTLLQVNALYCIANTTNSTGEVQVSDFLDTFASTLRLREPVQTPTIYNVPPKITSIDQDLRMDFSRMIGKPFHLTTFTWTSSMSVGTEVFTLGLPSALNALNKVASAPFDLSSLYYMHGCIILQVAGTPMHSGALCAAVTPREYQANNPETQLHAYQSAPHAFLHANNASSVCVEIPWYSNTKTRYTPSTNDNQDEIGFNSVSTANPNDYARLRLRVLSALGPPTSSATSVVVTVSIMFDDLQFFVPKASYPLVAQGLDVSEVVSPTCCTVFSTLASLARIFLYCYKKFHKEASKEEQSETLESQGLSSNASRAIDGLFSVGKKFTSDILDTSRSWITAYTGLHNPNIRVPEMREVMALRNNPNYVDSDTYLYKLDPYAQFSQPMEEAYSNTLVDEGLVSHICSKPMAVSRFAVTTSTASSTLLFTMPIHPCAFRQEIGGTVMVTAPIHKLALMSKYYSGSLKLTLQNCGSNFHMFKLLVVKEYFSSYQMATTGVNMQSALNLPTEIIEFSSGGQTADIHLPMNSVFDHIPISPDHLTNGLSHGKVSVFLLQPMVTNGAVVTSIDVVAHLSANPDFTLYGYACDLPYSLLNSDSFFEIMDKNDKKLIVKKSDCVDVAEYDKTVVKDTAQLYADSSFLPKTYTPPKSKFYLPDGTYALDYHMNDPLSRFRNFKLSNSDSSPLIITKKGQSYAVKDRAKEKTTPISVSLEKQSATAPENVSADPALVTPRESPPVERPNYLRPIVHIRDHARRMIPSLPILVPSATIASQAGVVYFDLYDLFVAMPLTSTRMNPLKMLSSMFSGYRGGLKVKLVVRGVPEASLCYLPPTPVIQNTGSNTLRYYASVPSATNPVADSLINSRFSPLNQSNANFYVGPSLEGSDWQRRCGLSDFSGYEATPSISSLPASCCILECEVPYMNLSRFVGSAGDDPTAPYTGSLGYLALGLSSQYVLSGGTTALPTVMVTPYVGADDAGRFLFQTVSNTCYLGYSTGTPFNTQDTVFQGAISDVPVLVSSSAPSYYVGAAAT